MKNYTSMFATLPWLMTGRGGNFNTAGDFDGDGKTELLIDGAWGTALGVVSHFSYSELAPAWQNQTGGGLAIIAAAQDTVDPAAENSGQWQPSSSDVYLAFDVDGDGADEIIAINAGTQWMGVLKWNAAKLETLWAQRNPNGLMVAGAQFQGISFRDNSGVVRRGVVLYNSIGPTLGVMTWTGTALYFSWQTQHVGGYHGGITVTNAEAMFTADVDGDGFEEVILLNTDARQLAVLKWESNQMQVLWSDPGLLPSWVYDGVPKVAGANFEGGAAQQLFFFNPQMTTLGVLGWQNGLLSSLWSAMLNAGGWLVSNTDQFQVLELPGSPVAAGILIYDALAAKMGVLAWENGKLGLVWSANSSTLPYYSSQVQLQVADVDGDGASELVMLNVPFHYVVVFKLQGDGSVQQYSLQNVEIPGWSLSLIGNGPATPLPGFTTSQQAVYAYVCNQVDPYCNNDIRSTYINLNDSDNLSGYSATMRNLVNPGTFNQQDWQTVTYALSHELLTAAHTWGLIDNMQDLALQLRMQQQTELDVVKENLQTVPADNDPMSFWGIQIADAVLWAAAALPIGPEFQIPLSMLASLFANLMWTDTSPVQITFGQYENALQDVFTSAENAAGSAGKSVNQDAVKMPLVAALADGVWKWDPSQSADIAKAVGPAERLVMYQAIMPALYRVALFPDQLNQEPPINVNVPAQAYWCDGSPYPDGKHWDVYMMYSGSTNMNDASSFTYPQETLIADIEVTFGVSKSTLFQCQQGWSQIELGTVVHGAGMAA